MVDNKQLYDSCLTLCNKTRLLPHKFGSLTLPFIADNETVHSINVAFHELGHYYGLEEDQQVAVLEIKHIPPNHLNNMDVYYNAMSNYDAYWNELTARAIQIGLNIIFELPPKYVELTGDEYTEDIVRRRIICPDIADKINQIIDDLEQV